MKTTGIIGLLIIISIGIGFGTFFSINLPNKSLSNGVVTVLGFFSFIT